MRILSATLQFALAYLLMALSNWIGLRAWRRSATAHWTERARLLWPVRFTAVTSVFLIPVLLNQANNLLFPHTQPGWIWNGVASILGALLGCYPLDRTIFPQLDFKKWWHQVVAGWGIRLGIWGLFLAALLLMPETPGAKMAVITVLYLLVHVAIQWGLLLWYLRRVKFVRPAGERLSQLVAAAAARMGTKTPITWQLDGPHALAFAFPTTRQLLFSEKLLDICTDKEISSICCHELAHLSESKTVLAGRLMGSLALFPLIYIIPLVHAFGGAGLIIPYSGLLAIAIFARRLSRRMETRADQIAFDQQQDEGAYAGALEKLYRENKIPAVNVNNRQTHPHLYDRMVAAGITPSYARPARPRRLTLMGWLFWIALAASFAANILWGRLWLAPEWATIQG